MVQIANEFGINLPAIQGAAEQSQMNQMNIQRGQQQMADDEMARGIRGQLATADLGDRPELLGQLATIRPQEAMQFYDFYESQDKADQARLRESNDDIMKSLYLVDMAIERGNDPAKAYQNALRFIPEAERGQFPDEYEENAFRSLQAKYLETDQLMDMLDDLRSQKAKTKAHERELESIRLRGEEARKTKETATAYGANSDKIGGMKESQIRKMVTDHLTVIDEFGEETKPSGDKVTEMTAQIIKAKRNNPDATLSDLLSPGEEFTSSGGITYTVK